MTWAHEGVWHLCSLLDQGVRLLVVGDDSPPYKQTEGKLDMT